AAVSHGLAWLTRLTGGRFVPIDGGAWDDFNHFTLVGRFLSALFDTGSVILVGLLGRRLWGPRVGLLAAALVAVIPFEVQVSHYYAVDTVLVFFVLLTLLACVRLVQHAAVAVDVAGEVDDALDRWLPRRPSWGIWRDGALVGAALGLAVATKVSALPLLVPVAIAVVLCARRRGIDEAVLAVLGIGAAALLAFVLTSPYVLIDWPTFSAQVREQTALSQGQLDYPYVRQFAGTTPYVYETQQLLLYDMGLPLGLLGLAGFVWAAARIWRRLDDDWLIVISWLVVYFAVIGSAYTKFTRYMLPVFPLLALCGAAMLGALALAGERWLVSHQARFTRSPVASWRDGMMRLPAAVGAWLAARFGARWWRVAVCALGLAILASSLFLALALDNIYSAPNTRVQASEWIYDHVRPGATITSEIWDDGLPITVPAARPGPGMGLTAAGQVIDPGQYLPQPLDLYAEDTPQKADTLARQLASSDVVVISSQRLLLSIPKLPDRYPLTIRYYQLLFAGKLGFHLAYHVENPPHLASFTLQDAGADESFSVYDHPPVWIFTRDGPPLTAVRLRALLTQGITLPAAAHRSGAQKSLLLTPASVAADAHSAPLAVQFPPDSLANRFPLVVWLLVIELLGLVSFPLAYSALPGLRDRGWGLSKLLGILLVGYLVWLSASLRWLPFATGTILAALGLLIAASAALLWRQRATMWHFVREHWRLLAISEAAFLLAFSYFTWVRALDPDLWHIWRGGEKPMELSFLNGILRTQYFPSPDLWFSGGSINYYYYGQYLIAVLIRLTGITPTTAFNLAIPLLFALTFSAAFSVVAGLTGRWWAGLAGGFGLVVVGNLDGAWQAIAQWWTLLHHIAPAPFDYWRSSRIIPFTINEFPYWSFLYADMHAHLIDLPVVVLVIACCASLLAASRKSERVPVPTLIVTTVALGATGCINTWDFPVCALLVAASLCLRELRFGERSGWREARACLRWPVLRRLGAQVVLVVGGAYLLYLPFYATYQTFVSGTGSVTTPTDPNQFFTLFGIWLFLVASFFVVELHDRWEQRLARRNPDSTERAPARLWGITLLSLLVLLVAYIAGVKALLIVLLAVGLLLGLNPRHSPIRLLTYALLVLGLAIALGVELIYVRDFLDNSDYERMNTVFKFYYQVWVCFALGGALAFAQFAPRVFGARAPDAMRDAMPAETTPAQGAMPWAGGSDAGTAPPRRHSGDAAIPSRQGNLSGQLLLRSAWLIALVALLSGSLVFLVDGTAARVEDPALWAQVQPPPGGIQPQGPSLDGMAYMRGWFPDEYAAIQWINA
ncbi:MAG TPA: DUF2298 domain-containing protein, partial [Ktedonobacterales bacterium]|nr:DUF2298 domain-containing protein [Ktedonobacterales bacterium]